MRNYLRLFVFISLLSTSSAYASGICNDSNFDCIYEGLESSACVGVNGYLGQINIASIQNIKTSGNLNFVLSLYDQDGSQYSSASTNLAAGAKFDFILNDLGLESDTIGTLCVETDASSTGQWQGGVTLYKPSSTSNFFADAFDYVLYFPFLNPNTEEKTLPLNTFKIGMGPNDYVANWVQVFDAVPGDSQGVTGVLTYYDQAGAVLDTVNVSIPDGGRQDFAAHEVLEANLVGSAKFVPTPSVGIKYLANVVRYYLDCRSGICDQIFSAVNVPERKRISTEVVAATSTVKNEISVLELTNIGSSLSSIDINMRNQFGDSNGQLSLPLAQYGTSHVIANSSHLGGFYEADKLGAAHISVVAGDVSAVSMFYRLDSNGFLKYVYSAPAIGKQATNSVSQFNSYIDNRIEVELVNLSASDHISNITLIDSFGNIVWRKLGVQIKAKGVTRLAPLLPSNKYGTVFIDSSTDLIIGRVYQGRNKEYLINFYNFPSTGVNSLAAGGEVLVAPIKFMPIGDSITESSYPLSSYRYWLWNWLVSSGINTDFVGSHHGVHLGSPRFTDFDQDNEGHWGWRADEVLAGMPEWAATYKPDFALIHLGSNDMFQDQDVTETINELGAIIDTLREENPFVVIVLAKLIPSTRKPANIQALNAVIPDLALEKDSPISPILLVDQGEGFNLTNYSYDGIHPNNWGDQKMASVWLSAIVDYLF